MIAAKALERVLPARRPVASIRRLPMSDDGATDSFLDRLNAGDATAIARAFELYFGRLQRLASGKMGPRVRAEPESIAMSAMGSLVAGLRDRRFKFDDAQKVWNLLVTITLNKIRKRATKGREEVMPLDLMQLLNREPSAEDFVAFMEICEKTLDGLQPPYPEIFAMALGGCTQQEMADRLGATRASVRPKLQRLTSRLKTLEAQMARE
jgi:RNA polymerase sigma-70 factor (ECF subfamily)